MLVRCRSQPGSLVGNLTNQRPSWNISLKLFLVNMENLWKADRFLLLSESIQGMRDGSFGPLNTGRNDIRIITNAIRHYSRGVWFLERGKKYIKAWFEFFARIPIFLTRTKISNQWKVVGNYPSNISQFSWGFFGCTFCTEGLSIDLGTFKR